MASTFHPASVRARAMKPSGVVARSARLLVIPDYEGKPASV